MNIDPGTPAPTHRVNAAAGSGGFLNTDWLPTHGEVFVLDDGGEDDLGLRQL
jgi:hypothetical protein